jgi:hypothetical protein
MLQPDRIHCDRRFDRRYEFDLPVRYCYSCDGATRVGMGRTVDLSRGGIRFIGDSAPPDRAGIEMRISWPFLLQNVCPLELYACGSVAKTDSRGTVMTMDRYEFRTCGTRSFTCGSGASDYYSFVA